MSTEDQMQHMANDVAGYRRDEFTGGVGMEVDEERRRVYLHVGDRLSLGLTAEEVSALLQLEKRLHVRERVATWMEQIADERARPEAWREHQQHRAIERELVERGMEQQTLPGATAGTPAEE
jgi:hypothetical protein